MGPDEKSSAGSDAFVYDSFAWKLADCLLEDFKPYLEAGFYDAAKLAIASRNVGSWRQLACGEFDNFGSNIYQLKTTRQITDLFKKFSFSQDVHTPEQLAAESTKKFVANQQRLLDFRIATDDVTRDIIWRARGWCDRILGDYSPLEVCERATFGKKSSVGIPMRKACEGERYESPITGSDDHIDWFAKYYRAFNRPAYEYASRTAAPERPLFRSIDILEAVLVPKTWKSLRMIMPNTTIGTLYSGGLGRVIEDRLRAFGYDIKHLQPVHGELARLGSLTGALVTADQSMASDNITTQLVDAIFPWRWARALNFGRIGRISLRGETIDSPTFSTMGIGFTFPLQTLLFLVLLLAIRDHLNLDEATVVSVFGDDLIYATEMHPLVVDVFPKLGLVLNLDKTFASGHFRESCGQDFYRGIDVRPFHLGRAVGRSAPKRRAEAYLYKALNGLIRRWGAYEVPLAAAFVRDELVRLRGSTPLVVPHDFPDTAGVKYDVWTLETLGLEPTGRRDVHGTLRFRYLAFQPDLRHEHRHEPYLFLKLRQPSVVERLPHPVRGHGSVLRESTPLFQEEDDLTSKAFRSETTGKRIRRRLTLIPDMDMGRYRERTGVASNWTPHHR